jgi:thiol:disulfide interchange protein DsbC
MNANAIRAALAATLLVTGLVAGAAEKDMAPTAANAAKSVPPAVEAAIRKNLPERLPNLGKVDEVTRTPVPGLYEVRVGTDLFYSDAEGGFLLNGEMMDLKNGRNITQERTNKLLAIDFSTLPLKDAFTIVRGDGKRKIAVFEDPNCGYCRRFEGDLQKVNNVTVYMFLYPILGPDSVEKSKAIWCGKDKGKIWQDWMVRGVAIPRSDLCDVAALDRNGEFGRKHKITGTPTLIFADGSRVPGAIGAAEVEQRLAANSGK